MRPLFSEVATRLPAQDLRRAREWYASKLGLEPIEAREGGLRYAVGSGEFCLFESSGQSSSTFTQMSLAVDDLAGLVAELSRRGVVFESYDTGALRTTGSIATIDGNYPSRGTGERAAWFSDSEGNLIGLGQAPG